MSTSANRKLISITHKNSGNIKKSRKKLLTEISILFVEILTADTVPRELVSQISDSQMSCQQRVRMLVATWHYNTCVSMFVLKKLGHTVRMSSADYPLVLLNLIDDKKLVTIKDIKKLLWVIICFSHFSLQEDNVTWLNFLFQLHYIQWAIKF